MEGGRGFMGVASSGSTSEAEVMVVEKDYVGLSEVATSRPATAGEEAEDARREEELELGLSLGAKKVAGSGGGRAAPPGPWGQRCRILTANDFPSLGCRASPRSSSTSSVSSSSAALGGGAAGGGGGVAGIKRAADSVSPDVVGSGNLPSQVVVGWPPIRAFRMNSLFNQSKDNNTSEANAGAHKKTHRNDTNMKEAANGNNDQLDHEGRTSGSSRFVKVNMDGDPIGRKVDLNAHRTYETLALSLELMFHKPNMALIDSVPGVKASKLLDSSSEFALTYEDQDGDWMLVGDVPWGMFLDTVKRLRIMRTSDASGLAPRFQSSKNSCGLI